MMRGSLAATASKDRLSASASMLPPIASRSVHNNSKEGHSVEGDYRNSPRQNFRTQGGRKPPASYSVMPNSSKGTSRKKGANQLLISSNLNQGYKIKNTNNRQTLGPVDLSTPVMMRGIRKKEMVGSKHVNP